MPKDEVCRIKAMEQVVVLPCRKDHDLSSEGRGKGGAMVFYLRLMPLHNRQPVEQLLPRFMGWASNHFPQGRPQGSAQVNRGIADRDVGGHELG